MNKFRQILQDGVALASQHKLNEALLKFDEAVDEEVKQVDQRWVCLIYKNAGLIHERQGNLREAKASFLAALKHNESDAYIHFSLGSVCERMRQQDAAHRYFARARELAYQEKDEDLLAMLLERGDE